MGASYQPEPGQSYATDPIAQWYSKKVPEYSSYVSSGAADAGVPFDMWRWMGSSGGSGGRGDRGGQKMVPTVAPTAMQGQPQGGSQGLMPQNGANWNQVYGQMQVPTPYLNMLNNRFGWDNQRTFGAATPFDTSRPQFYQPPTVYPETSFPSLVR